MGRLLYWAKRRLGMVGALAIVVGLVAALVYVGITELADWLARA